ncbi:MAG: ABC transporter substrate-binding protein [Paracoccaceae bacterium]
MPALALVVVLAGCAMARSPWTPLGALATGTVTPDRAEPTATPSAVLAANVSPTATAPSQSPSPTPSPTPTPSVLTVCVAAEPEALIPHIDQSYTARLVQAAIYDGPIDVVDYGLRPVALTELPDVGDGADGHGETDAEIEAVWVHAGDLVVSDAGEIITLAPGARVRPVGCRSTDCAVIFSGGGLEMERMRATFQLRANLRWANGDPVTAHDSVFSYRLATDPLLPADSPLQRATADYRALDDRTVVWTGLPGYLAPAYRTAFWTPLPRAAWRNLSAAEVREQESGVRTPLGYGPYTVAAWEPGRAIRLERNPYYRDARGGTPYFDQVRFRFIAADPVGALGELAAGRCDLLTRDLDLEAAPAVLARVEAEGAIRLVAHPSAVWEHLTFNVAAGDRTPYFREPLTRRAVALCIDREALARERARPLDAADGLDLVLETYVAPEHPLYAGDVITRAPFAPELGRALLASVGWRDADADGVREAHGVDGVAEGTPFRVRYATLDDPERQAVAAFIAEALADCGIAVEVETYPAWIFYAQSPDGILAARAYDLAQGAWTFAEQSSGGLVPRCNLYTTDAVPGPENDWAGHNVGGYSDSDFDAACQAALRAVPGEPAYAEGHREAQRIFSRDLPALPLYRRVDVVATRPELEGVIPDALAVETWAIEAFAVVTPAPWR